MEGASAGSAELRADSPGFSLQDLGQVPATPGLSFSICQMGVLGSFDGFLCLVCSEMRKWGQGGEFLEPNAFLSDALFLTACRVSQKLLQWWW